MTTPANDTRPVHPHVTARTVEVTSKPGDHHAVIAYATVIPTGRGTEPVVSVATFVSPDDGATVLEIDTHTEGEHLRLNVNDGLVYETTAARTTTGRARSTTSSTSTSAATPPRHCSPWPATAISPWSGWTARSSPATSPSAASP
ncbi:hypothetical protein [Amycolatopsis magusensis]|uniref:hypothetical protein n=1 Tax=Amycolatopsis magusensis TaxID=882444 RepID=UPI00378D7FC1